MCVAARAWAERARCFLLLDMSEACALSFAPHHVPGAAFGSGAALGSDGGVCVQRCTSQASGVLPCALIVVVVTAILDVDHGLRSRHGGLHLRSQCDTTSSACGGGCYTPREIVSLVGVWMFCGGLCMCPNRLRQGCT